MKVNSLSSSVPTIFLSISIDGFLSFQVSSTANIEEYEIHRALSFLLLHHADPVCRKVWKDARSPSTYQCKTLSF